MNPMTTTEYTLATFSGFRCNDSPHRVPTRLVPYPRRFADALETAEDPDLRWRYTMQAAASLALADFGDVAGAAARAATSFQHAEAYALKEGELAEATNDTLREVHTGIYAQYIGGPDACCRQLSWKCASAITIG